MPATNTAAIAHAQRNSKVLCFNVSALLPTAAGEAVAVAVAAAAAVVAGDEEAPAPTAGFSVVVAGVAVGEDSVTSGAAGEVAVGDDPDGATAVLAKPCTSAVTSWPFLAQRSISFWREAGRWGPWC